MIIPTISKVAGVTFANEEKDGGRNRQDILKDFVDRGIHTIDLKLVKTKYEGENAIMLYEKNTKEMIGWVPKMNIEKLWRYNRLIGIISKYKDTYSVELCVPQDPTPKQYAYCKELCRKKGYMMPVYDKRVYSTFLASLRPEREKA